MATKSKSTKTRSSATKNASKSGKMRKTASDKRANTPEAINRHVGWSFLWTLVGVIVSTFFLFGVDDAIFGTSQRILADYVSSSSTLPWEEIVARQLSSDIFVPIFWGSLVTVVEVFILFKTKMYNRGATSAIMIVILWLLPIVLAAVRIAAAYGYII